MRYGIIRNEDKRQITYISRCCNSKRYNLNEEDVMNTLNQFSIAAVMVKFDNTSFEQQVRIMYKTILLISIHGSQLSNMVFMLPGSAVIEIVNPLFSIWFFKELSEKTELYYSLFQHTAIPPEPHRGVGRGWCATVNYNTIVNTTLLFPVVEESIKRARNGRTNAT